MVDLHSFHAVLIEMHGGMLTLATLCIVGILIARFHRRMRRTAKWYGVFWPLDTILDKLERYAEPTAYLAGIGGAVGLVASAIVGYYVWPAETLMNSSLGLNKIFVSIFATELWILFIVVRSKYGEDLWKNGGLAATYVCIGFAGFLFMITTGSFGGHMTFGESILDPVWQFLGVNVEAFWIIRLDWLPILISIAFIEIVTLFVAFLRSR